MASCQCGPVFTFAKSGAPQIRRRLFTVIGGYGGGRIYEELDDRDESSVAKSKRA